MYEEGRKEAQAQQCNLHIVRRSALSWWNNLSKSEQKDEEYKTFGYDEDWSGVLTERDIITMYNNE